VTTVNPGTDGPFGALKQAETHLTHAFQKLGIRSRADLAAALSG